VVSYITKYWLRILLVVLIIGISSFALPSKLQGNLSNILILLAIPSFLARWLEILLRPLPVVQRLVFKIIMAIVLVAGVGLSCAAYWLQSWGFLLVFGIGLIPPVLWLASRPKGTEIHALGYRNKAIPMWQWIPGLEMRVLDNGTPMLRFADVPLRARRWLIFLLPYLSVVGAYLYLAKYKFVWYDYLLGFLPYVFILAVWYGTRLGRVLSASIDEQLKLLTDEAQQEQRKQAFSAIEAGLIIIGVLGEVIASNRP